MFMNPTIVDFIVYMPIVFVLGRLATGGNLISIKNVKIVWLRKM